MVVILTLKYTFLLQFAVESALKLLLGTRECTHMAQKCGADRLHNNKNSLLMACFIGSISVRIGSFYTRISFKLFTTLLQMLVIFY